MRLKQAISNNKSYFLRQLTAQKHDCYFVVSDNGEKLGEIVFTKKGMLHVESDEFLCYDFLQLIRKTQPKFIRIAQKNSQTLLNQISKIDNYVKRSIFLYRFNTDKFFGELVDGNALLQERDKTAENQLLGAFFEMAWNYDGRRLCLEFEDEIKRHFGKVYDGSGRHGDLLTIRRGKRVIAQVYIDFRVDVNGLKEAMISGLYVKPEYRGKKFGRLLMEEAISKLISEETLPYLIVESENTVAINLYENLDFKHLGEYVVFERIGKK